MLFRSTSYSGYYDWDSGNFAYVDNDTGQVYSQEVTPFEPSVSQKDQKKYGDVLGADLARKADRVPAEGQYVHPDVQDDLSQTAARAASGSVEYGPNTLSEIDPYSDEIPPSGIDSRGLLASEVQARNREEMPYANEQYPTGLIDSNGVPDRVGGQSSQEDFNKGYEDAIAYGSGLSMEQMYMDGVQPTVNERFIRCGSANGEDGKESGAFYENIDGGYSYIEKSGGGMRVTSMYPGGLGSPKDGVTTVNENGRPIGSFGVRYYPNVDDQGSFLAVSRHKPYREDQPEKSSGSFESQETDKYEWWNREAASRTATVVPDAVADELRSESMKMRKTS